jgi:hypothetical protein
MGLAFGGSPDLGKLVLSLWSAGRSDVHVLGPQGWQGVTVGPSSVLRAWVGVGPTGLAWALFPHDSAAQGKPVPYSLFEQQP